MIGFIESAGKSGIILEDQAATARHHWTAGRAAASSPVACLGYLSSHSVGAAASRVDSEYSESMCSSSHSAAVDGYLQVNGCY
jgi:hypothetical protein